MINTLTLDLFFFLFFIFLQQQKKSEKKKKIRQRPRENTFLDGAREEEKRICDVIMLSVFSGFSCCYIIISTHTQSNQTSAKKRYLKIYFICFI